jgi:hypothetical protein
MRGMVMTDMTDELKKLLAAATPGPWFVSGVRFKMNGCEWHSIQRHNKATKQDDNICCVGYDPRTDEGRADAALIAAAINALPGLLDELERLREAIKRQAAAVRNLQTSEDSQINVLRKQSQQAYIAVSTLDSERAMNAILTEENERLRAALSKIEDAETEWGSGVDDNMNRVRGIASAALKGT